MSKKLLLPAALIFLAQAAGAQPQAQSLGVFTGEQDIGTVLHAGAAQYDPNSAAYDITGSGVNMWFTNDAFHYVFKQVSGDVRLTADIRFLTPGGNAHRKACLVLRQSLDPGSVYADAAAHGNGLTALQWRATPNDKTFEVIETDAAQATLSIEKRGQFVTVSMARAGETLHPAGGEFPIAFQDPFYIGLGVCAHDSNAVEKAEFTNVKIDSLAPVQGPPVRGPLSVEIVPVSGDRRVVWTGGDPVEALAWSDDGKSLIFRNGLQNFEASIAGGIPKRLDSAFTFPADNHGVSPNGKWIASIVLEGQASVLQIALANGLAPARALTKFFTGPGQVVTPAWSPDSKQIAIVSYHPLFLATPTSQP